MKHAIVIAALSLLVGCMTEVEVATPAGATTGKWEQLANGFYKHKDTQNGVTCYTFYPGSATSASLACVKG